MPRKILNSITTLDKELEAQGLALASRSSDRAHQYREVLDSLRKSLSDHVEMLKLLEEGAGLETAARVAEAEAKKTARLGPRKVPGQPATFAVPEAHTAVVPIEPLVHPDPVDQEYISTLARPVKVRASGLGLGDIMFALPACMEMGNVHFSMTCFQSPYGWASNHPYSNEQYRRRTYQKLAELIDIQPYVTWAGAMDYDFQAEYDVDFDGVRTHGWPRAQDGVDMLRMYLDYVGSGFNLNRKWLVAPDECYSRFKEHILLQFNDRAVVDWIDFSVLKPLKDRLVFLGLGREYKFWRENGGFPIEHVKSGSVLDMAVLIKSVELYIGCSSAPVVIAEGLKVRRIYCQWLRRPFFKPYGNMATTVTTHDEFVAALQKRGLLEGAVSSQITDR
tara:strand:+ start:181 stop:1353 length:1173 start_codon:yes stop_codon:yes gene_type:complete